jgi:hypothetical protein
MLLKTGRWVLLMVARWFIFKPKEKSQFQIGK